IAAGARKRHGVRAAQPAWRHHHRRIAALPVADAVHHSGDLPLHGTSARAPCARAIQPAASPARPPRQGPAVNFSHPFIRRPIRTTLMAIGLFLVGAVAYTFLPVASLPSVEFPTINITANLPGADPNVMAAARARP